MMVPGWACADCGEKPAAPSTEGEGRGGGGAAEIIRKGKEETYSRPSDVHAPTSDAGAWGTLVVPPPPSLTVRPLVAVAPSEEEQLTLETPAGNADDYGQPDAEAGVAVSSGSTQLLVESVSTSAYAAGIADTARPGIGAATESQGVVLIESARDLLRSASASAVARPTSTARSTSLYVYGSDSSIQLSDPGNTSRRMLRACICAPRACRDLVQRPTAVLLCISTLCLLTASTVRASTATLGPDHWNGKAICRRPPVDTGYLYMLALGTNYGILTLLTACVATWALCNVYTKKLRRVTWFLVLAWVKAVVNYFHVALNLGDLDNDLQAMHWLLRVGAPVDALYLAWVYVVAHQNTRTLERAMLRRLGSRCVLSLSALLIPAALATLTVSWVFERPGNDAGAIYYVFSLLCWTVTACLLAMALVMIVSSYIVWRHVASAATRAMPGEVEEAQRSERTCFVLMSVTGCSLLTSFLSVFTRHLIFQRLWPLDNIPWWVCVSNLPVDFLDTIANTALMLVPSGVLSGALGPTLAAAETESARKFQRQRITGIRKRRKPASDDGWGEVVEDLASRGFTLEALLDFYGGLGRDYMPQFDPARSTTKDVVRAAIIPRSREQGCALAKLMMDGVPTRPQAMVTHTWGNRFSDLVAAIVADALDDSCFAFARRLLDEKPERLHELLAWRGVLHKTYWVCAFSVNQHAAICGGGRDVDEVLQTPHPHCDCDHPKYWNDTPPASEDGRSIRCEMNKFDDMMKSLATSDKRFYQVIAMDRAFVTLSRCWCVAEIVEAHKSGMSQIIKIFDAATLRDNLQALDTLRVEDMAASRPEDVAEILSKIPDKDSFNERYRAIVQEGISRWSDMPFSDKIARAGRFWLHSMN